MSDTNMNQATKVITGEVRFSYLHVFEKSSINGGDEKYSVSLLIPKTDKKTIAAINKAIEAAKQAGIGKFGGKIPAVLKLPLRDGDDERPEDETYAGCYFVNANCNQQHTVRNGIKAEAQQSQHVNHQNEEYQPQVVDYLFPCSAHWMTRGFATSCLDCLNGCPHVE